MTRIRLETQIAGPMSPLGPLGWLADRLVLDRYMRRSLEVRNDEIKREAERGPRATA